MLTTSFLFLHSSLPYISGHHWWTEILGLSQNKTHLTTRNQDSCTTIKWGETARTLKHPAECTCPGKGQAHRHLSQQVWEMVGSAQAFYCSWRSEHIQLRAITGKGNTLQHKRQGCCTQLCFAYTVLSLMPLFGKRGLLCQGSLPGTSYRQQY